MLRAFFVASVLAVVSADWPGSVWSCNEWTYPLGGDKKVKCDDGLWMDSPNIRCVSCASCAKECKTRQISKFGMCVKQPLHTKYFQQLPCSGVFKCVCTDTPASEGCKLCNRECQAEGHFVSGTCDKKTYTCQCKYPNPLTAAQRDVIIAEHNQRRTNMTRGRETGGDGKLPQASNVFRLTWDTNLELLARRLASVCKGVFDSYRDEIPNQGMNVWRAPRKVGPVSAAKQATAWWWSLKENFFVKEMDSDMEVGQDHVLDADCYPFTQMAWGILSRFACAIGSCNISTSTIVACVYERSIHQNRDAKLYTPGKPCSGCKGAGGTNRQCKPPNTFLCTTS